MVLKDIENILSKNIKIFSYEVKISYIILFLIFIFVASGCTIGCSSKLCLGDFKGLLSNTREYMENRVNTQNQKNMEEALASQKREQEKMREQQRIREQQRKIKEMQEHQKRQRLLQEKQKKSENQLAKQNKVKISRPSGTSALSALVNLAGL